MRPSPECQVKDGTEGNAAFSPLSSGYLRIKTPAIIKPQSPQPSNSAGEGVQRQIEYIPQ